MNPDLAQLKKYPFERLSELFSGLEPPKFLKNIPLSIGEPKHSPPEFVAEVINSSMDKLSVYPSTKGTLELRSTIACWLKTRFNLHYIDPESQVLPVNGTREALFSFAQSTINRSADPLILMPNPFYQIYEGAAILSGANIHFLNCDHKTGFLADFNSVAEKTWESCQLIYICSPGNPNGAVLSLDKMQELIILADRYDFIIASDE